MLGPGIQAYAGDRRQSQRGRPHSMDLLVEACLSTMLEGPDGLRILAV